MAKRTQGSAPSVFSDRYEFDFKHCKGSDGWAQLDTRQDAPYYGNWINPLSFKLVCYCEGDVSLTECDDEADFIATLRECIDWHKERGYWIGIDAYRPEMRAAFERMGFGDCLH